MLVQSASGVFATTLGYNVKNENLSPSVTLMIFMTEMCFDIDREEQCVHVECAREELTVVSGVQTPST